jgi:hypothetical protein
MRFPLAGLAARNVARLLLRGHRRTPAQSHAEYEARWKGILAAREWERSPTLRQFLFDAPEEVTALVGGKIVRLPLSEYLMHRHRQIYSNLAPLVGEANTLVEIGAGWGGNLFGLATNNAPWKLIGCDLSESGLTAGRAIAQRFGLPIDFLPIDLLDGEHPSYRLLCGNAVFTHYCLEQLPCHTEAVIENITRAQPRIVIHFEPAYELLNPLRPLHLVTWLYIRSRDYQRCLLRALRSFERQGRIRIIEARLLNYAPAPQHFPMLVAWRPA